jgi:cell division septum initiation protein DivIVA
MKKFSEYLEERRGLNENNNVALDFKQTVEELMRSVASMSHKVEQLQQLSRSFLSGKPMTAVEAQAIVSSAKQLSEYYAHLGKMMNAYGQSQMLNKARDTMANHVPNYQTGPLPPPPKKAGY